MKSFLEFYNLLEQGTKDSLNKTIDYLKEKDNILFLTTSNRWEGDKDIPKSSLLAINIQNEISQKKVRIIDVSKLKIYDCEGNVSKRDGNNCGVKESVLKDKKKNPSGLHRCWASINNKDDELWKVSKELLDSDVVIFFGSVRWGQANGVYQRLMERLSWLDNRHTTLNESNVLKNIEAGIIFIGQNWNGSEVINTQKKVLEFFGFKVPDELSWNWQYTNDYNDESQRSYKAAYGKFKKDLSLNIIYD